MRPRWPTLVPTVLALLFLVAGSAQVSPRLGDSGYQPSIHQLNATEKAAIAKITEFATRFIQTRAGVTEPLLTGAARQLLHFQPWTNETLRSRHQDATRSWEAPVVFGVQYYLNFTVRPHELDVARVFRVAVHQDVNRRLTVTQFFERSATSASPKAADACVTPGSCPPRGTRGLSVLSWNLWNFNRPWKERLALLVQEINDLQPPVVGFQEVRYATNVDQFPDDYFQVAHLAAKLPTYQFVYQPAMTYLEGPRTATGQAHTDEGLAVFSLYPILESSHLRLSRDRMDPEDDHQRIVLRTLIQTPLGNLNFFVTHLSLSLSARRRTAPEVWAFVTHFEGPSVIVGDFNEEPSSILVSFLTGREEIGGVRGDFVDVWTATHPTEDGRTFSTDRPRKRIDFILARNPAGNLTVLSARVVGSRTRQVAGQTVFASDHFGLLSTLDWSNAASLADGSTSDHSGSIFPGCILFTLVFVVGLDLFNCYVAVKSQHD